MRVMLDTSIFAHSQFADSARWHQGPRFGARNQHLEVSGFLRRKPHPSSEYQGEIDALFTIGRLGREKQFEAYTYTELQFEKMSWPIGEPAFNALYRCPITRCPSPIERSRLQRGPLRFRDLKQDEKRAPIDVKSDQVLFIQWLCSLDANSVEALVSHRDVIGLTNFEVESLRNLGCLQGMCKNRGSKNYPDMLHLWTAQRNQIEIFLTLESKLPNIAAEITRTKAIKTEYPTRVMRPLEFLNLLGARRVDPVPIQSGCFYPAHEVLFPPNMSVRFPDDFRGPY